VLEILRYYRNVSPRLVDEFQKELQDTIDQAAANPLRFSPTIENFRRAILTRFPYHFLYEVYPSAIRVIPVRHHKRNPQFGLERR
jgi:toxin ParE1/3/4